MSAVNVMLITNMVTMMATMNKYLRDEDFVVRKKGGDLMMCRKESSSSHALKIMMLPPWYTAFNTHVMKTRKHSRRPF